ncbi:hypothetical protein [Tuwongella immobilis]|uniref:hypothetical protein n=1 Tax=Tuwongella immobilis TaxID=692036 RepID=UPI0013A6B3A7|nr:hypothetical protein [Tuwongella immobilis]
MPANPDPGRSSYVFYSFVMAITANLIPIFLLFVTSFVVLKKVNQIRANEERAELVKAVSDAVMGNLSGVSPGGNSPSAVFDNFGKVPWTQFFAGCSNLDIVVHYFDTWINQHEVQLKKMLDRGGRIRIILPNYKNDELVALIKERFPDYTKEQVKKKIQNTFAKLEQIRVKAIHKHAIVVAYDVDSAPWYCGVSFDHRELVLSPYEHDRSLSVAAPATLVELPRLPAFQEWFEKEFAFLMGKAVETRPKV